MGLTPRAPAATKKNKLRIGIIDIGVFTFFKPRREGRSGTRVAATATFSSPESTEQMRNSLLVCKILIMKPNAISLFFVPDPGYQILASTSWLPDLGYQILASRSWLPGPGFQIPATRCWLPDLGHQMLASRSWRPDLGYQILTTTFQRPGPGY